MVGYLGPMTIFNGDAVEQKEGGGRHNRSTGFLRDMERENLAVLAGWAVLKISPDMIKKGTAHLLVEKALIELDPAYLTEGQ